MLELKNIRKEYKTIEENVVALKNINIEFRECEFVSILGQSGCGKTTLLNIIGGLDNYTSGDLIINGKSTKKYKDKDWDSYRNHNVGFVFQSYNLIPHQTVLQNVELALTLSGVSRDERKKRAIEVLKKVGLEKQINKKPNQMSGGQMQRVAIARALVNDPDIILADEPTGALDSKTSVQIMELLKEISKDKLIIMVTHNPTLAKDYSSRIIKVLDGEVVDDSNPYNSKKEKSNIREKLEKGTSMSFLTALSLSFNNLKTKKSRTLLTAFAGSIGIIGIALILSLSSGMRAYIDKIQKDTLSTYPITIERESIDMSSMLTTMMGENKNNEHELDKIYSNNIMSNMITSMTRKLQSNNLEAFKNYIDKLEEIKNYTTAIQYSYDLTLNLYNMDSFNKIVQVNPSNLFKELGMSGYDDSSSMMFNVEVWQEMLNNEELLKEQYDLLDGAWPTKFNEVVLVVDENNEVSDYTLYTLGLMDKEKLVKILQDVMVGKSSEDVDNVSYNYDELIGKTFKLLLETDYYKKENGHWVNKSDNQEFVNKLLDDALEIKVVGIIRPNEEANIGSVNGNILYSNKLTSYVIDKVNNSEIVKEQLNNTQKNIVTGVKFDDDLSYEDALSNLGYVDVNVPSRINIYPKDFDSKESIMNLIDNYNNEQKNKGIEENVINYSDLVGTMMNSVTSIINIITYVLIAFVSISLIVSSIMIGIITYISVLERTKEIGILRAIGASKKDVSRVFNAETIIIGFTSGAMGIVITLLLNIPINALIKLIVGVSNIASLPLYGALSLIIISMLLTYIAGLVPAKVASRKDPVVALRSE